MARPHVISMGYAKEKNTRSITLDINDLVRKWPGLVPKISVTRPKVPDAYFAEKTEFDGKSITWIFTGYDMEYEGSGTAQVYMMDGDAMLGMSEQMVTNIAKSNGTSFAPGEWHEGFAASVAQDAAKAQIAAINASASAEQTNAVLDEIKEKLESGEFKGDEGFSPTVKVEEIYGGHRITITDKDGEHTWDVLDGAGTPYDDSEIRTLIQSLESTKADKKDIPAPYDDSTVKASIASLQSTKADKSEIKPPYDDTKVKQEIAELKDTKADKTQIPSPYDDTEVKQSIQSLESGKADKSEIPSPYDDSAVKSDIQSLKNTKADKSEIPQPYDDSAVKSDIQSLKNNKADKSEIPPAYDDTKVKQDITTLESNKADKSELPAPYNDTAIKADIKSLQDNKADKSEIPAPYDDTQIQKKIDDLSESVEQQISGLESKTDSLRSDKQDKLTAGDGIEISDDGTISSLGGGDIIQDPDNPNAGMVVPSTLAGIDNTLKLENYAADAKVVGEKITKLGDDIAKLATIGEASINLFDKDAADITESNYIQSGTLTASSGYSVSGYIPVAYGATYTMPAYSGYFGDWAAKRVSIFDSEKNYVDNSVGAINGDKNTFTVNFTNAAYIRVTFAKSQRDAFMVVEGNTYPDTYHPYTSGATVFNKDVLTASGAEMNPLRGKKICCDGDSIMYGAGFAGGFAKIIGQRNGMTVINKAESGGTIKSGTYYSNGNARHWICESVATLDADADYYIVDGWVNDVDPAEVKDMGSITSTYTETLDTSTFCGAFEQMCKTLVQQYAGKKIGYVFVHRIWRPNSEVANTYINNMIDILHKWGVPYCDLLNNTPSLYLNAGLKSAYTYGADGWHPNEDGYKLYYCDKIEAWLKTL